MPFQAIVEESKTLGIAIQQALLATGLSQRELAERVGTTQ